MKANFKLISSLLIIALAILLITVFVNYYTEPIEISNIDENIADTNQEIDIVENVSGEITTNIPSKSSNAIESGDKIISNSGDIVSNKGVSDKKDNPAKENQVIITSEDTMTDKEKRQILTELDDTLMDLLEVVDKVQTVDESRLITNESEVQE